MSIYYSWPLKVPSYETEPQNYIVSKGTGKTPAGQVFLQALIDLEEEEKKSYNLSKKRKQMNKKNRSKKKQNAEEVIVEEEESDSSDSAGDNGDNGEKYMFHKRTRIAGNDW